MGRRSSIRGSELSFENEWSLFTPGPSSLSDTRGRLRRCVNQDHRFLTASVLGDVGDSEEPLLRIHCSHVPSRSSDRGSGLRDFRGSGRTRLDQAIDRIGIQSVPLVPVNLFCSTFPAAAQLRSLEFARVSTIAFLRIEYSMFPWSSSCVRISGGACSTKICLFAALFRTSSALVFHLVMRSSQKAAGLRMVCDMTASLLDVALSNLSCSIVQHSNTIFAVAA